MPPMTAGGSWALGDGSRKDAMRDFKEQKLDERMRRAAEAKRQILEKFRSRPADDDPAVLERRAKRAEIAAARAAREAERKRIKEEQAAAKAAQEAVEKAARIEREKREAIERVIREAAEAAERKAERDRRYAARKARAQKR
ncbi:MAG: DUF6481 family protein [Bacteroidota bacterium]|jgi:hypothetical protein